MTPMPQRGKTIDEYISTFPEDIQHLLQKMRETIKNVEPQFEETISYGIPTFRLNGKNVVHFGGYPTHIGFYPAPMGIEAFKKELADYGSGKGTVRFELGRPIPYELVEKIVKYRVKQVNGKLKSE